MNGQDHANRAAQAQARLAVADVNRAPVERVNQPLRAQVTQDRLVLDNAQVAFLARDGAVFFAHLADGHNRIGRQVELLRAFLVELAQDDDHQRLVQPVMRATIAELGHSLKDAVIIVVQQLESAQRQPRLKNLTVAMDEIIIVLVGLDVLMQKRLAEQTIHHTRNIALGFFGQRGRFEDGCSIKWH